MNRINLTIQPNLKNSITKREREVLHLIAHEHTSKEIASELYISTETVLSHRRNIMHKMNVRNVAGMVRVGMERGLVGGLKMSHVSLMLLLLVSSLCISIAQTPIPIDNDDDVEYDGNIIEFDDQVFFTANPDNSTYYLYYISSNGISEKVNMALFQPQEFTVIGSRMYFSSGEFNDRKAYYIEAGTNYSPIEIQGTYENPTDFISDNNQNIYFQGAAGIFQWNSSMNSLLQISNSVGRKWFQGGEGWYVNDHEKHIMIVNNFLFFHQSNGVFYVNLSNSSAMEQLVPGSGAPFRYGQGISTDNDGCFVDDKVVYAVDSDGGFSPDRLLIIDASSNTLTSSTLNIERATSFMVYHDLLFFMAFNSNFDYVVHYYDPDNNTLSEVLGNNIVVTHPTQSLV